MPERALVPGVADAQERVEAWREDYNRVRPRSSLENMTPEDFANQAAARHPLGDGLGNPTTTTKTQQPGEAVSLIG